MPLLKGSHPFMDTPAPSTRSPSLVNPHELLLPPEYVCPWGASVSPGIRTRETLLGHHRGSRTQMKLIQYLQEGCVLGGSGSLLKQNGGNLKEKHLCWKVKVTLLSFPHSSRTRLWGSPLVNTGGSDDKELACNVGGIGKIPWRREWQSTLVFLPREFHWQRSLAVYSPGGHKELDTTEWLVLSLSFPSEHIYWVDQKVHSGFSVGY